MLYSLRYLEINTDTYRHKKRIVFSLGNHHSLCMFSGITSKKRKENFVIKHAYRRRFTSIGKLLMSPTRIKNVALSLEKTKWRMVDGDNDTEIWLKWV